MLEVVGKRVLAVEMEQGDRTYGTIFIMNDDGKRAGIRSRWCKVYKIGPEVSTVEPGEWILVEHGRWTQTFSAKDDEGNDTEFWIIDYPKGVIASAEEKPSDFFNIGIE